MKHRDPVRVILMWFLLTVYGVPTMFAMMCWTAGVKPFAWWILVWGGTATLVGVLYGEAKR